MTRKKQNYKNAIRELPLNQSVKTSRQLSYHHHLKSLSFPPFVLCIVDIMNAIPMCFCVMFGLPREQGFEPVDLKTQILNTNG